MARFKLDRNTISEKNNKELWQVLLSREGVISGMEDDGWKKAIVIDVAKDNAEIGLSNGNKGIIPLSDVLWAKSVVDGKKSDVAISSVAQVLKVGDIIFVKLSDEKNKIYHNRCMRSLAEQLRQRLARP